MHLSPEKVRAAEERWGRPRVASAVHEITPAELDFIRRSSTRRQRAHDLTLYILRGRQVVLTQKPGYPAEVWRPPSGGCRPGETLEEGIRREAWEETGLRVRPVRYLVRLETLFRAGGDEEPWVTHVFVLRPTGGMLASRDPGEISAVRWGSLEELNGPGRQRLLSTGRALFAYRVRVHDLAREALEREGRG